MHVLLEPLLRLFAALVSHGGEPRLDRNQFGPVLIYPLRPGAVVFLLGGLVFAAFAISDRLFHLIHHHPAHLPLWAVALAAFIGPLSLLLLTRTLSLDEVGLHRRDLFGLGTTIPWSGLHHVERYQSRSAGKATFYIRSADQRTTLAIPEMTYDTAHLLRTIRERVPFPELPRQRRHWWGG